jgi:hypothetical protein
VLLLTVTVTAGLALAEEPKSKPEPGKEEAQAPKKRQRVVSNLSGFELLDAAKLDDKPVVAGATRALPGPEPPLILAPHLAKLHGVSPLFAWRNPGDLFLFVLSDESGRDVHTATVAGQSYTWPADAPRLADSATYFWSVRPASGSSGVRASMAALVVVTAAERAQIDAALEATEADDPYAAGLARAQVLVDGRVWYDALGAYSDLIDRFPERPEAYARRAELFAQLPATQQQAEEDFVQADRRTAE